MKSTAIILGNLLLVCMLSGIAKAEDPEPSPTPVAAITMLTDAEESARMIVTITYSNGKKDRIFTKRIEKGTTPQAKALELESAINSQQTQGVVAVSGDGTVRLFALKKPENGGNSITGIQVSDGTNQVISLNPIDLNTPETPKNASFTIAGTGSCLDGTISLNFDAMDVEAEVPTYGKTGYQVVRELATLLQDAIQVEGIAIQPVSMGENTGRLYILNIPSELSEFTFDIGGACGFYGEISVSTEEKLEIPTLTEWGVIFLVMATMGIGVFRIMRV